MAGLGGPKVLLLWAGLLGLARCKYSFLSDHNVVSFWNSWNIVEMLNFVSAACFRCVCVCTCVCVCVCARTCMYVHAHVSQLKFPFLQHGSQATRMSFLQYYWLHTQKDLTQHIVTYSSLPQRGMWLTLNAASSLSLCSGMIFYTLHSVGGFTQN